MLSKLRERVLIGVVAAIVGFGFVWFINWILHQGSAAAAEIIRTKSTVMVITPSGKNSVVDEVLALEPVIIYAPNEQTVSQGSNSAVQMLERIVIVATAINDAKADEVNAKNPDNTSIPEEVAHQIAKDLTDLHALVPEALPVAEKTPIGAANEEEKSVTGSSTALSTERIGGILVERIVLDEHLPTLSLWWTFQDSLFKKANPFYDKRDKHGRVVVEGLWSKASRLSNIPYTEKAWKTLKSGTVILVPASGIYVRSDVTFTSLGVGEKFPDKKSGTVLQEVIPTDPAKEAAAMLGPIVGSQATEIGALNESNRMTNFVAWLLGIAAGGFAVAALVLAGKNHRQMQEMQKLHDDYLALGKRLREQESGKFSGEADQHNCACGTKPGGGSSCCASQAEKNNASCCSSKKDDNGSSCCDPR